MISVGLCCLPAAFIVVTEVDRVLAQHPEYAPEAFPLKLAAMLHVNEHDGLAYVLSASKSKDLRKALNATDGTPSNLLIILKSALSEYQRSN
jgi:hypothetical protein